LLSGDDGIYFIVETAMGRWRGARAQPNGRNSRLASFILFFYLTLPYSKYYFICKTTQKECYMTTLVIDRETLPETLFSLMGANRIKVEGDADRIVLTPATETDAPIRKPTIDEIFDAHLFSMKDFRFDRDEANNYD
jgi:hypothetical protein